MVKIMQSDNEYPQTRANTPTDSQVNVRKSTRKPISEGRDPESLLFDTLIPAVMKVNEKEILAV
jgi:hypothetical protein